MAKGIWPLTFLCVLFVQQTGIFFEERGRGTFLAQTSTIAPSSFYSPKKVNVRESMDKSKEGASNEARKIYIASLLVPPITNQSQFNGISI